MHLSFPDSNSTALSVVFSPFSYQPLVNLLSEFHLFFTFLIESKLAHIGIGILWAEFSHRATTRQLVDWSVEWVSLGLVFARAHCDRSCSGLVLLPLWGTWGRNFPQNVAVVTAGAKPTCIEKYYDYLKGLEGIRICFMMGRWPLIFLKLQIITFSFPFFFY